MPSELEARPPEKSRRGRGKGDVGRSTWIAGFVVLAALVGLGVYFFRPGGPKKPVVTKGATTASKDNALEALPYVNFVPVKEEHRGKSGTTIHKRERAYRGYNLYIRKPDSAAVLVDMQGELVHEWSSKEGQADYLVAPYMVGWQTVQMTRQGELLAVVADGVLLKLDWDSKLVWKAAIPAHHDIAIGENGDIYALTEDVRLVDIGGKKRAIQDHGVAILSADGSVKERISFYDLFIKHETLAGTLQRMTDSRFRRLDRDGLDAVIATRDANLAERENRDGDETWENVFLKKALESSEGRDQLKRLIVTGKPEGELRRALTLLRAAPGTPSDVFHSNTVLPLKKHEKGLWKEGDLMLSFRRYDLVAVLDMAEKRIGWMWGPGEVQGQHQPSILPNGNLLVFDNGTTGQQPHPPGLTPNRKYSRVVELDPVEKKEVWVYVANPPKSFATTAEGGCQRLPNGNILVTESGAGRAFELTPEKEIVWEYFNPTFDKAGKQRSGMYRLERLSPEVVEPLLERKR